MLFEKQLLRWFHTIGGQCRNDVLLSYVFELHLRKKKEKYNRIEIPASINGFTYSFI